MKYQILFSENNKKNIINLSSTESGHSMVNVKAAIICKIRLQLLLVFMIDQLNRCENIHCHLARLLKWFPCVLHAH